MTDAWVGNRWAGDTRYGHCSACGKPATAGEDGDWWHSYATHIVECPAGPHGGEFIEEGRF